MFEEIASYSNFCENLKKNMMIVTNDIVKTA